MFTVVDLSAGTKNKHLKDRENNDVKTYMWKFGNKSGVIEEKRYYDKDAKVWKIDNKKVDEQGNLTNEYQDPYRIMEIDPKTYIGQSYDQFKTTPDQYINQLAPIINAE